MGPTVAENPHSRTMCVASSGADKRSLDASVDGSERTTISAAWPPSVLGYLTARDNRHNCENEPRDHVNQRENHSARLPGSTTGAQQDLAGQRSDPIFVRFTLSLLAVCHWRSQRLAAGVQATAEAFTAADRRQEPESSSLTRMWDLAVIAVPEGLLGVLAGVSVDDADADTVQALDAATALLAYAGD